MGFVPNGEAVSGAHDLHELKLVYRVLHNALPQAPELMDTEFLIELQSFLHAQATAEGVDIGDHGAWDAWLGNHDVSSCSTRVARRREIRED